MQRNNRAFEEEEMSFEHLSSILQSLIYFYFWCTHVGLGYIKDWVSFVEDHVFCKKKKILVNHN